MSHSKVDPMSNCLACKLRGDALSGINPQTVAVAGFLVGYAVGVCDTRDVRTRLCSLHLALFNKECERYGCAVQGETP